MGRNKTIMKMVHRAKMRKAKAKAIVARKAAASK